MLPMYCSSNEFDNDLIKFHKFDRRHTTFFRAIIPAFFLINVLIRLNVSLLKFYQMIQALDS